MTGDNPISQPDNLRLNRRDILRVGLTGARAIPALLPNDDPLIAALARAEKAERELAKTQAALASAQQIIAANASMAPEYMAMLKRNAEREIANACDSFRSLVLETNEQLAIVSPLIFPKDSDPGSESRLSQVIETQDAVKDDIEIIRKIIADYEEKRTQFPDLPTLNIPAHQRPEALTAKYDGMWPEMMEKAKAIDALYAACAEVREHLKALEDFSVTVTVPESATPEQDRHEFMFDRSPLVQQHFLNEFMRSAVSDIEFGHPKFSIGGLTTEEIQALTSKIAAGALPAFVEHAVSEVRGECMQIACSSAFHGRIAAESVRESAANLQAQFSAAIERKLRIGAAPNLLAAAAAGALVGAAAAAVHDDGCSTDDEVQARNAQMEAAASPAGALLLEQLPAATLPKDWKARILEEPSTAAVRTT